MTFKKLYYIHIHNRFFFIVLESRYLHKSYIINFFLHCQKGECNVLNLILELVALTSEKKTKSELEDSIEFDHKSRNATLLADLQFVLESVRDKRAINLTSNVCLFFYFPSRFFSSCALVDPRQFPRFLENLGKSLEKTSRSSSCPTRRANKFLLYIDNGSGEPYVADINNEEASRGIRRHCAPFFHIRKFNFDNVCQKVRLGQPIYIFPFSRPLSPQVFRPLFCSLFPHSFARPFSYCHISLV